MSAVDQSKKLRVGVLISGRGSNLGALIDAAKSETFPARMVVVISNRADAPGLELARSVGIETHIIPHKDFPDRQKFDAELTARLRTHNVDLVCLAGFMRILSEEFVTCWAGRLINIHPSLLPAYKGLNVHQRMIDDRVEVAGCTVHYVTKDMDAGPIIGQRSVRVKPGDTADDLAARILREEHILYPECVKRVAQTKRGAQSPGAN